MLTSLRKAKQFYNKRILNLHWFAKETIDSKILYTSGLPQHCSGEPLNHLVSEISAHQVGPNSFRWLLQYTIAPSIDRAYVQYEVIWQYYKMSRSCLHFERLQDCIHKSWLLMQCWNRKGIHNHLCWQQAPSKCKVFGHLIYWTNAEKSLIDAHRIIHTQRCASLTMWQVENLTCG